MRNSNLCRRPRLWRPLVLATVAAVVLLAGVVGRPPAAAAGGPGVWTAVSGPVGSLLVQPRAVRGAAGTLHVVWMIAGTPQSLMYSPIAADGVVGTAQALASGWSSLSNPAVVVDGNAADQVLVFAGGIRSGAPAETHDGLNWWRSSDDGATWGLEPGLVSGPGGTAYSSDVAAVATGSGIFQTWFSTFGVFCHRGVLPGIDYDLNDVGDYGYNSTLAYDDEKGALSVVAAYNATGAEGLWVRAIDQATGGALGASAKLPQSSTSYGGGQAFDLKQMQVPAIGLPGQGAVVVAYPTGYPTSATLRVWRLSASGTTTTTLATGGSGKGATAVAADAEGRAWVVWTESSGTRRHVFACRSNPGATVWGQTVSVMGPSGTDTLWQLAAAAQAGKLDVLGQFTRGGDNVIYHTQLLAGLSVSVSPAKARVGAAFTTTVTVKDAGVAQSGAHVRIGGKTATTGASGTASIKVKAAKPGSLRVTVTKGGYATTTATIKIIR